MYILANSFVRIEDNKNRCQLIKKITKTCKEKFIDERRFRLSDRPVQVANTNKLLEKFPSLKFVDLESSLTSYLEWRGVIKQKK